MYTAQPTRLIERVIGEMAGSGHPTLGGLGYRGDSLIVQDAFGKIIGIERFQF